MHSQTVLTDHFPVKPGFGFAGFPWVSSSQILILSITHWTSENSNWAWTQCQWVSLLSSRLLICISNMYLYSNYNTLPITNLHCFQILCIIHKFIYHKDLLPYYQLQCLLMPENWIVIVLPSLSVYTLLGLWSLLAGVISYIMHVLCCRWRCAGG